MNRISTGATMNDEIRRLTEEWLEAQRTAWCARVIADNAAAQALASEAQERGAKLRLKEACGQ